MSINPNLLIAAKIIYDECGKHNCSDECDKHNCSDECQLHAICYNYAPHNWSIPDPPPEPTERPRIEWMRALPDYEMLYAAVQLKKYNMKWWHRETTLEKFREEIKQGTDESEIYNGEMH